ncbi:bifunctional riboflavin kinase/FAD synthetase [Stappia sp. GBMRC 2046]|uniref:Riboflavin biosynthesis protein n=1 Tax=Stappia sediminis TaxID=2692190 RepID=A0A7X3S8T7_9HYPH|nr:bifunctional riboflavin kinase/FAD synthetase [Stappia sediminis]MXN66152.1 bifunctional riboflavin kinase/FAD synthetase [Stappia sediminis]
MTAAPPPDFTTVTELSAFPQALRGGVVAIGNFDGVHRGHQAVLGTAMREAEKRGVPAFAMTFEPHPRTFFNPSKPVFRLTPQAAKARVMRALGLNGMVVLPFTREFAGLEAQAFVDDVLQNSLHIVHAVTGYDFHFGKARKGTPDFLKAAGVADGFGVTIVEAETDENGETVSSSRIREALAAGDVALANALLGYRWFFEAKVQHGDKRGRDLGYPTANLTLSPEAELAHGIYAVRVKHGGTAHDGVASHGRRPTFDNGQPLFEVHLFDFSGDLYGHELEVELVSYLREERRFESAEALIAQMDIDSAEARAAIQSLQPLSPLDLALGEMGFDGASV